MTRPYLADLAQVDTDDLAARRLERDRQREAGAGIIRHITRPAAVRVSLDPSVTALACPACNAPVFALSHDAGEHLDCSDCDARLVTRRGIGDELEAIHHG